MTETFVKRALDLPGWLSPEEAYLLYYLTKQQCLKGAVVEIGSYKGKSAVFIAQALKETGSFKLTSIDPHEGIPDPAKSKLSSSLQDFKSNVRHFGLTKFIQIMQTISIKAGKKWNKPVSLVYIDALHSYEFAKEDLVTWLPFLTKEGIVICHDAFGPVYPGVFKAIKETIIDSNKYSYIGAVGSHIFAIKGERKTFWQNLNYRRSVFFISMAMKVWQRKNIHPKLIFFVVNFLLKPFFLNQFTFRATVKRYLKLPISSFPTKAVVYRSL